MKRLPIFSTILVLAAVVTMIALGVWQLGRADEKSALLARYAQAKQMQSAVDWPETTAEAEAMLYRRSTVDCTEVLSVEPRAGTSATGAKGWGQRANCRIAGSDKTTAIDIGWSKQPEAARWTGGVVDGIVAPGGRLVASESVAGLELLARPDPADLPNNHLAYAGQWFLFALTALVIYFLALRSKWRKADEVDN